MRRQLLKQAPVRISGRHYRELRVRVLRRDGWHCQMCGAASNLTVHHQQCSHAGDDAEQNLITLSAACHSAVHGVAENQAQGELRIGNLLVLRMAHPGRFQTGTFRESR